MQSSVTIKQMAALAGGSYQTVSRLLNHPVTGFDDTPSSQYLLPPLATIRLAERIRFKMLIIVKGGAPAEQHVLLKPKLILRATA